MNDEFKILEINEDNVLYQLTDAMWDKMKDDTNNKLKIERIDYLFIRLTYLLIDKNELSNHWLDQENKNFRVSLTI